MSNIKRYSGSAWQPVEIDADTLGGRVDSDGNATATWVSTLDTTKKLKDGALITTFDANNIKYDGATLTCVAQNDTLEQAIVKLDAGIDAAKKAIPSGVLTTSNYASTLGSVYQAKNGMLDALSTSVIGADSVVVYDGFKFGGSTYEALAGKLNQYVKIPFNNVMLKNSETVWVYADDIPWDETHANTSVKDVINNVRELALGRTKSVVLTQGDLNAIAVIAGVDIKVPKTSSTSSVEVKLNDFGSDSAVSALKKTFNSLKVGDIVYTEPTEYKDWWVSAVGDDPDASGEKIVTLSQFDADSVTVANTYSPSSSVAISGQGVAAALGTLDVSDTAVSGQYVSSVKETDGKISVTRASLPTSLPASNTTSTYSSTGTAPVNGKAVDSALSKAVSSSSSDNGVSVTLGGTVQSPTVAVSVNTSANPAMGDANLVTGEKLYIMFSNHATKVFCQANEPPKASSLGNAVGGAVTGDIWIDI